MASSVGRYSGRSGRFLLVFGLVALIIAGGLSYLADSDPDGLDSATRQGCVAVETAGEEVLNGRCIAQETGDHALAGGPFADYTVAGDDRWVGVAGVVGVAATLAVSWGLFLALRREGTTGRDG